MKDFKKESHIQNKQIKSEHTNSASDTQKAISDTTAQMKVKSKIEITITRQQLSTAKWLFEQAGKQKPSWLRQKFLLNQRRRKTLNVELMEAGLDKEYCGHAQNIKDWDGLLHELWHQVNEVPSCV
jgi:hypothetical protein